MPNVTDVLVSDDSLISLAVWVSAGEPPGPLIPGPLIARAKPGF